jgi:hypothetical protein
MTAPGWTRSDPAPDLAESCSQINGAGKDRRQLDASDERMMVEKLEQPAMAIRVSVERRERPLAPSIGNRRLKHQNWRFCRPPKAQGELGLFGFAGLHALGIQPLTDRSEALDEGGIEALMTLIDRVPLAARRRHLEKFNLIAASGHRIGEPVDRVFDRELTTVRGSVELDAIDRAGLAARRRRMRDQLSGVRVALQVGVILGGGDVPGDGAQNPRPGLEIHLT